MDNYNLSLDEIMQLRRDGMSSHNYKIKYIRIPPQEEFPPPPQRPQERQPPQRPQQQRPLLSPQPFSFAELPLDQAIPIWKGRHGCLNRKSDTNLASEKRRYEEASSSKSPAAGQDSFWKGRHGCLNWKSDTNLASEKRRYEEASSSKSAATGQDFEDTDFPRKFYGQRGPTIRVKLREIDPLTHSLDEIIEKVKDVPVKPPPDILKKEEESSSGSKKRVKKPVPCTSASAIDANRRVDKPIVRDMEFPKYTPWQAVGFLTNKGMTVEMQIGQQDDPNGDRAHKWRCIINCGPIDVVADSVRKVVAREMASVEFLQQLRQVYKDCKIPDYKMVEEIFISPYIFHFLEKEGIERRLDVQYEVVIRSVIRPGHKRGVFFLFICTYFVGNKVYKGESFRQEFAKLAAAKNAYEGLTGKKFLPTKYFTGGNCDPSLKYTFGEREVFQTVAMLPEGGDPDYDVDDWDDIPRNADEAMQKRARTMMSERFKQSKKDEEKARRHMPVNMQSFRDEYDEVDADDEDEYEEDGDEEDGDEEDGEEEEDEEEDEDEDEEDDDEEDWEVGNYY